MKYAYEDLSDDQFEHLTVIICQEIFGLATQGFAKGPDGGRDAKFVGTADLFPSRSAPWTGTTIIQAKHTNGYNKHFSDSDFFAPDSVSAVLTKEIPRIQNLIAKKGLDNYILFANRKIGGNAESEIRTYICDKTGLSEESVYLCDVEQIETWIKSFPGIEKRADLDPLDSPLIVSPDELAEVVAAFASQKEKGIKFEDVPPSPRIPYAEKNQINNMTPEYAKTLRSRYLKETAQIRSFLAAPENIELMQLYENVIDEFQLKIVAKRKDYQDFDNVMNYLIDLLFNRDPILRRHKRLTRALLFYMYWNCDIGSEGNAETN